MSQPAEKQEARKEEGEAKDPSGRFSIDERRLATVLPPAGQDADLVALEDLGAVLEAEPDKAASESTRPRPLTSGVFAAGRPPATPPPPPPAARVPRSFAPDAIGIGRSGERAQLELEDLSLRLDNPYAASSLVPPPREPLSIAKIAGAGIALVVLAVAGTLVVRGLSSEPQAAAPAATPTKRAPSPVQETDAVRAGQVAPAPAAPVAAKAAPQPTAASASTTAPVVQSKPIEARTEEPAAASTAPVTAVPAPAAPAADSAAPAAEAAAPAPAVEAAAPAALPETPTREQIRAGFAAVHDALVQCAAGKHGVAQINAAIAGSGRISHALVGGAFQGSAEGSCMARIVRSARFPQFTQPTLKVSYPVAL